MTGEPRWYINRYVVRYATGSADLKTRQIYWTYYIMLQIISPKMLVISLASLGIGGIYFLRDKVPFSLITDFFSSISTV
jgi:hypothetical protein